MRVHRFTPRPLRHVFRVAVGLVVLMAPHIAAAQSEWLTWGYDQQRSGWNKSETTLTRDNVSRLELNWKVQLSKIGRAHV